MGLSFLRRKKKKGAVALPDEIEDSARRASTPTKDHTSVNHLAVLQCATLSSYDVSSHGGESISKSSIIGKSSVKSKNSKSSFARNKFGKPKPPTVPPPALITPVKSSDAPDLITPDHINANATISTYDGTPDTTAPSPANEFTSSTPTNLISPPPLCPNTQDDTPLHSNQMNMLEKDVGTFELRIVDGNGNTYSAETESRGEGPPGLPTGKKYKKNRRKKKKDGTTKKKKGMRFIQPSKRDTAPIAISPRDEEKEYNEYVVEYEKNESQYDTSILAINGSGAGVELELSLLTDDAIDVDTVCQSVGNEKCARSSTARSIAQSNTASTRDGTALSRKNLASLFNTSSEDEGDGNNNNANAATNTANSEDDTMTISTEPFIAATAAADIEPKNSTTQRISRVPSETPRDNRFLSRLRRIPSKKSTTKQMQQLFDINEIDDHIGAPMPVNNNANDATANQMGANHPAVPQFINDYGDEASMPSMLTEPEIKRIRSRRLVTHIQQPSQRDQGREDTNNSRSTNRTNNRGRGNNRLNGVCSPQSLAEITSAEESGATTAVSETFFEQVTAVTAATVATPMTIMSSAAQAGGIEKLLSALTCGEDTTIGEAVGKVLKCEPCGRIEKVERDDVDLELEGEEKFALEFQSDIIQNGIKLIYHESPTRASTNPDWIQSTIKLFLRPGDCHGTELKQPTLAWAVLPVVSRMRGMIDTDALGDGDANRWNRLGLLDVHSILADETDSNGNNNDSGSESKTAANNNNAALSTGFFSITAKKTGAVYVFEAPTSQRRDYVVRGIRSVISRLTYHMIAGDANVIGELYSEDAGQMTGELPSLVSPSQALARVTHGFLDQQ